MRYRLFRRGLATALLVCSLSLSVIGQEIITILSGTELSRTVPSGFYFQGLSAATQLRNSAAARLGSNRHVIAGLVDTSGYSSEVREKYQGFFITDSTISIGGNTIEVGAYGFGFTSDSKFNLLDLSGKQILSVSATKDASLSRPRPLMMTKSGEQIRLYSGRDYIEISVK